MTRSLILSACLLAAAGCAADIRGLSDQEMACVAQNAARTTTGGDLDAQAPTAQVELIATACGTGRSVAQDDAVRVAILTAGVTAR